jgi:hypothetical protein
MADKTVIRDEQKREWQRPEVKRILANSAEAGAGIVADAGENSMS